MDKPLVSVVIPTYSRPTFLKRCIESVLNQTYENIEIFVVDDNNPDTDSRTDTELVMTEYKDNNRIKYIQHECNKNGSAARNTGWKKSTGKYITYLDDDDIIERTKIQKQVECLEKLDESWGACYTGYRLIKEHGQNQVSSEKRSGNCYIYALMRTMFMGSGSNLLVRKKIVDEINGYDESFKRNQDIEFLVRVLENYKLAYVDEILLTIFQEGNREKRTFEQIDSYTKHYLNKFESRINKLSIQDRKRILNVISLERSRVALQKGKYRKALSIIKDEKVAVFSIVKYILYLIKRVITHKSHGFSL